MVVLYPYYQQEFLQTHDLNFKYLKTVKDCAPNFVFWKSSLISSIMDSHYVRLYINGPTSAGPKLYNSSSMYICT